ncbi:MAG TPA: hypothetical protein VF250_15475 [Conexibacter sp.]
MAEARDPQLPSNVPPALRAAVAAAIEWLRELDREAADEAAVRRPR